MTKDELEKEATEYALEWGDKTDGTYACCRDGYLASAEPREKRIEELEKENNRLILGNKLISEKLISVTKGKFDLQKENAKLKSIADFQTSSNIDRYFQLKRSKEQLTKAKDIIRDYKIVVEGDYTTVCSVPEENCCINVLKLNEQADQFLKECQNEGR